MCLIKDCDNSGYARGLCKKHHRSACGHIKCGKTTWDDLIAKGLALPVRNDYLLPRDTDIFTEKSELMLLYKGDKDKVHAHLRRVREKIMSGASLT